MSNPSQLVQKLWNYCSILRDDGLSYGDYVEQLTFLLLLKMADEPSKRPFNMALTVAEHAWIVAEAEQSVNFVTCHDGFTLNDLW
jgi:type I restriction enzyme M protein